MPAKIVVRGSPSEGFVFSSDGIVGLPGTDLFTASEQGVSVTSGIVIGPDLIWLLIIACDVSEALFHGPEWSLEDVRGQVEECQPTLDQIEEFEFRCKTGIKDSVEHEGFGYSRDVRGNKAWIGRRPSSDDET